MGGVEEIREPGDEAKAAIERFHCSQPLCTQQKLIHVIVHEKTSLNTIISSTYMVYD